MGGIAAAVAANLLSGDVHHVAREKPHCQFHLLARKLFLVERCECIVKCEVYES